MKKRTTITVVTRERVIARHLRVRCHQCGADVPIVTTEKAAKVLQTSSREIHGLLASGDLHSVEETSDASPICGNSLLATTNDSEPPAIAGESRSIKGERQ